MKLSTNGEFHQITIIKIIEGKQDNLVKNQD